MRTILTKTNDGRVIRRLVPDTPADVELLRRLKAEGKVP